VKIRTIVKQIWVTKAENEIIARAFKVVSTVKLNPAFIISCRPLDWEGLNDEQKSYFELKMSSGETFIITSDI
jgi:hypothetical protein